MELHPDLQEALTVTPGGFDMIHHPLVVTLYHPVDFMIEHANGMYEAKKKALDEAFRVSDWHQFVFLHERPYRWEAFGEINDHITDDGDYWKLFHDVYIDSENIYQHKEEVEEFLLETRDDPQLMMDARDFKEYLSLPDTVTIYRGTAYDPLHFSWTLDKERAKWFAKRFDQGGKVYVLEIPRDEVLAVLTGRNEQEVLIDPSSIYEVREV